MDVSLESLTLTDNATHWDSNPPAGILLLTWHFPRLNMDKPLITWVKAFGAVPDNFSPQLNKQDWFETLAFRQTTDSKSVIAAEFNVVKDNGLMADILNAILQFGITSAGGLIAQPLLASVFAAATKDIKVKDEQIIPVGYGYAEIDPKSKANTKVDIPLLVPNSIEVLRDNQQTIPSQRTSGITLPKGKHNGSVILNLN